MKLKRIVAAGAMVGALGFSALGLGAGLAYADPAGPFIPGPHPGHDAPFDTHWGGDPGRFHFQGAPWGDGPAPWGWGDPPAVTGWQPPPDGVAPAPFNYWGNNVQPVWDTGYNQWGFWLFGIWIPL